MGVPDTSTFTLVDVKNAVAGSPNSLTAAFTASTDAFFDVTYKGSKDRLSNFRNYIELFVYADLSDMYFDYEGNPLIGNEIIISSSGSWTASWSDGTYFSADTYTGGNGDSMFISCLGFNETMDTFADTLIIELDADPLQYAEVLLYQEIA